MRRLGIPLRGSIGAKIFGAFIAVTLITSALGGYGLYVLWAAGDIVVDTYDRPLMAINFARAANYDFAEMDNERLQRLLAPEDQRPAIDKKIDKLAETLFDDLDVAAQRSLADDERAVIRQIRSLVGDWNAVRRKDAPSSSELASLSDRIDDRFDMLIELTADHSFVERRKAVWSISGFEYISIGASLLALLLSAAITALLARRINRPLAAAAAVANRIAAGELQTPIPEGGADETGTLLRSMTIMQDNIRMMMEREAAQRRSAQNRLVDALESSREGMVLLDPAGRIVVTNSQLTSFFPAISPRLVAGSDFAEVFGSTFLIAGAAAPDPAPTTLGIDGEFQLGDGRWIRCSRSATKAGDCFLFFSDFTDIKEREERFKDATKRAEAANTAKSQFLANMSHELRTPLNAIIGFSEVISGQMFGPISPPRYIEYAGDILQSGRHLLAIINSVLDLAKSDAGKLKLHAEMVDLRIVLDDCVTMLREQCASAELTLEIGWPDEPLMISGEPAKLRQIFLNLLSNAVKFTEAGGTISLSATAGACIEARVADTGIGMAPQDIPIALAPFGQVDGRLARRYEGTGLGLPLTKALVELHNATMTIDSERGRGTIVTVAFARAGSARIAA